MPEPLRHRGDLPDHDAGPELRDRVRAALAAKEALFIQGGGTKLRRYGRRCTGTPVSTSTHRGIIRYRPEELVLTARAGTPIADLEAAAADEGQILPFEAPAGGGAATLGGSLACGAAGPARPWRGSLRDAVLGVRLINGHGEVLRFGGDVIKNVAGYDVARLQAGALGCLGLITEVSLRLLPRPDDVLCLSAPCPREAAVAQLRAAAAPARPLTGAAWHQGCLRLRFEGTPAALAAVRREHSAMEETDESFWTQLREGELPGFNREPLFLYDLAPATPLNDGDMPLIDWAGGRRYSTQNLSLEEAARSGATGRGAVQRLNCGDRDEGVLPEPPPPLRQILEGVKEAMDPSRLLNPGRLYAWL